MPKRQRWTPVKGTGSRVIDPAERLLMHVIDTPGRVWRALRPAETTPLPLPPHELREVLVTRLDRIGDVIMTLPALARLRAALPNAHIRLAVGAWSEEIARHAPVDEVLIWNAPWVGRANEGENGWSRIVRQARALKSSHLDLGLDLTGDVRALGLLWMTGARFRVGFANTGGAHYLTHVLPLDESLSCIEENSISIARVVGNVEANPVPLTPNNKDAEWARQWLNDTERPRPYIALHPSGGRAIKQWPVERWAVVAAQLQENVGASLFVTGTTADQPLFTRLNALLPQPALDLTGKMTLGQSLAFIKKMDLFLSPDTGPMHMAIAVGTPSVSVFGPSDPARYFSGRGLPKHRVVAPTLWCAPCNLIRHPPSECAERDAPECLDMISAEQVLAAAMDLLAQPRTEAP